MQTGIKIQTISISGQMGIFTEDYLPLSAEKGHIWPCSGHSVFIFLSDHYESSR